MRKVRSLIEIIVALIILLINIVPTYSNAGYKKKSSGAPSFTEYIEVDSIEDLADAYKAFGDGKVYQLPNGTKLNSTTEFAEAKLKVLKEKEEKEKKAAEEEAKKEKESGKEVVTKNESVKEPYIHYPATYNQAETVFIYDLNYVEEAYNKYPNAKFQAVGVSSSALNSKLSTLKSKKAKEELEEKQSSEKTDTTKQEVSDGKINPNDFDPTKNNPLQADDYDRVAKVTQTIINVLRTVGIVAAVIGLMAIGIKYMVGSVEQKAEYKKTMIPYVVGLVMIFTITQLVSLIYTITTQIKV